MKTADFLPDDAFEAHLERRRTPRRLAVLCTFSLLCLTASRLVAWEAQSVEQQALNAEQPDSDALVARADLRQVFSEMSQYATRLDPLTEHLREPEVGWLLAGIAGAAGPEVRLEQLSWTRESKKDARGQVEEDLHLEVVAVVVGDQALLNLAGKVGSFSGYATAHTGSTEVVPGRPDAMRVKVDLDGSNTLWTQLEGAQP